MFGLFDEVIDAVATVGSVATGAAIGIATLGQAGGITGNDIARLAASGYTLYQISDATGVAVDVLEDILD